MMRKPRFKQPVFVDDPKYVHKETIEEFLARGGTITKIHANTASPVTNQPMIHVDNISIPVPSSQYEYVPSFVSSESTYVAAQQETVTSEDIGLSQSWREYEHDSVRSYQSKRSIREEN